MIARYSRPAMAEIWSSQGRFSKLLEVEKAASAAWSELRAVPPEAAEAIGRA
ncbi:MAG: adenylosuccinate lyase, partial [Actinobacteria bacterium]|nr:adenylosuccinate lyase [Actinomycetota bacterium]